MQLSHKLSFYSFFLIEAPQYAQHCDGGQNRHGSCSLVATSLAYTGHHSSFFLPPKHQDITQQKAYHRNWSEVKHKTSHFLAWPSMPWPMQSSLHMACPIQRDLCSTSRTTCLMNLQGVTFQMKDNLLFSLFLPFLSDPTQGTSFRQ